MAKLSEMEVLTALDKAVSPQSAYVASEIDKAHNAKIRAGGEGFPPSRGLILARLRSLEAAGKVECLRGPDGYYGYTWRITAAGIAALDSNVPQGNGYSGCSMPPGACGCPQSDRRKCRRAHWVQRGTDSCGQGGAV